MHIFTRFVPLLLVALLIRAATALPAATPDDFEFFAMDNGVGRGKWTPELQAVKLKEIGYHGISYNYTIPADAKAWVAQLQARQLKFYGLYFSVRVDGSDPFPPGLPEAVATLKGTGAVLWVIVPKPAAPGDYEAAALRRVQETADLAAGVGLRVVLYPHKNFYLSTAEQALTLVNKVSRANVGLTVNLAHEIAAGNGVRLPEIIRLVAARLAMVTVNGASDRPDSTWDNYIKRLDEGDYDVAGIWRTLGRVGYRGPIGLQSYSSLLSR